MRLIADQAPELTGHLDELGRGDTFERTIGIQIAEVVRETSYVTRLLRDPEPAVQSRALAAVARGVPVSDDDLRILYDDAPAVLRSKLVSLVRRTRREHLWRTAATALIGIVATNPDDGLDELVDVVRSLARFEDDPDLPNATADRDHPARQRLTYLAQQLCAQLSGRSATVRQLLKQVAAELTSPDLLHLRLQLLVTSLQVSQLGDELAALRRTVVDNPIAALSAGDLLRARLSATDPTWTPAAVLPVADPLAHSADAPSGFLALALIAAAGPRAGWPSEWRALLAALRNHPHPAVRHHALDLTTANEP